MIKKLQTIKERIGKIVEKWYIIEPLCFITWTTHELAINTAIKTIRTGKGRIEYNPEFIDTLSDADLYELLKCESIRILLKHPYSRKKEIESINYLASNITLKEYTTTSINFPNASQIFGSEEFNKKHFEFYYYKLIEQSQKQNVFSDNLAESETKEEQSDAESPGNSTSQQDDENNSDSTGDGNNSTNKDKNQKETDDNSRENSNEKQKNSFESQNKQEPTNSENRKAKTIGEQLCEQKTSFENADEWDVDELMQNKINEKIQDAMQRNSWGSLSYSIKELIIASLTPKVDYRNIIKAFRSSVLSQNRVLTRMKPSRRYGFLYMGSRRDFATRLLIAVDVSGSMTNKDIAMGYSVINHFFKYGIKEIDVIQFDAAIQGKIMTFKKSKSQINVTGRGGTNFQPVIDYIDIHQEYDGLIIFTDGYASTPKRKKNRKTKILWLFNTEENYKHTYQNVSKLGKAAFIRE